MKWMRRATMKFAPYKLFALLVLGALLSADNLAKGSVPATILSILPGSPTNCDYPSRGGMVLANDGNFYGTTTGDGVYGWGTVFRMTPAGVVPPLVQFDGTNYGINPSGGLMQSSDGFMYGTTFGNGTVNGVIQWG